VRSSAIALTARRAPIIEGVPELLDLLLPLWTDPNARRDDPEAAFRRVYADPVVVNGVDMSVGQLVQRAASLQEAFAHLSMEVLDVVETGNRLVLAFLMHGRHTGTFVSAVGDVAPTGRDIEVRTIDVLTVEAGKITRIWVVADDLGLLRQLGALN
jgi:predicted ester cyclase